MVRRVLVILLVVLVPAASALAQGETEAAIKRAAEWLVQQQLPDGGFGMPGSEASDVGLTVDVVIALASAGVDPRSVQQGGRTPLDFLAAEAATLSAGDVGKAAKVVLAFQAVGQDLRTEPVASLLDSLSGAFDEAGTFLGQGPYEQALVMLALVNAGEGLPAGAVDSLLATRLDDGSFSFTGDRTPGMGDSNTTAMAVQALVAAGARASIGPSLDYFRAVQNEDGGWTYQKPSPYGEETDANSTALVIQALEAAGESLQAWGDPAQVLRSFQLPSGAFSYNSSFPDENLMATAQAIPALAGVDFSEVASLGDRGEGTFLGLQPTTLTVSVLALLIVVLVGAFVLARRRG